MYDKYSGTRLFNTVMWEWSSDHEAQVEEEFIELFKKSPEAAILLLIDYGLIDSLRDHHTIAYYIISMKRLQKLDKILLGRLLTASKRISSYHLLKAFAWESRLPQRSSFEHSLRHFLGFFKIVEDYSVIQMVARAFASVFINSNFVVFRSEEAAFITIFSAMMLDVFTSGSKSSPVKEMTNYQFLETIRSVPSGDSISASLAYKLHKSITAHSLDCFVTQNSVNLVMKIASAELKIAHNLNSKFSKKTVRFEEERLKISKNSIPNSNEKVFHNIKNVRFIDDDVIEKYSKQRKTQMIEQISSEYDDKPSLWLPPTEAYITRMAHYLPLWNTQEVLVWLEQTDLSKHYEILYLTIFLKYFFTIHKRAFEEEDIDGAILCQLDIECLIDLGVVAYIEQIRILESVKMYLMSPNQKHQIDYNPTNKKHQIDYHTNKINYDTAHEIDYVNTLPTKESNVVWKDSASILGRKTTLTLDNIAKELANDMIDKAVSDTNYETKNVVDGNQYEEQNVQLIENYIQSNDSSERDKHEIGIQGKNKLQRIHNTFRIEGSNPLIDLKMMPRKSYPIIKAENTIKSAVRPWGIFTAYKTSNKARRVFGKPKLQHSRGIINKSKGMKSFSFSGLINSRRSMYNDHGNSNSFQNTMVPTLKDEKIHFEKERIDTKSKALLNSTSASDVAIIEYAHDNPLFARGSNFPSKVSTRNSKKGELKKKRSFLSRFSPKFRRRRRKQ